MTLFALVVGGMEVIRPAAAGVLGDFPDFRPVFQRRQSTVPEVPSQCASVCSSVLPVLAAGCTVTQCCLATYETQLFNCFMCVGEATNTTDYGEPQITMDMVYDICASLGIQLAPLTFPGQNQNQNLSSVVLFPSSQTTVSTIPSSPTPSIVETTVSASSTSPRTTVASPQATVTSPQATVASPQATVTNTPTATSSSGIRSVDCFSLIASAMILGAWFHFAM